MANKVYKDAKSALEGVLQDGMYETQTLFSRMFPWPLANTPAFGA